MINSRYRLLSETGESSGREVLHLLRHTIFQSYGVNLQSSLTRVISSASGFSPCPPVSVCSTITHHTRCVAFLESMEPVTSGLMPTYSDLRLMKPWICHESHPTSLNMLFHPHAHLSFSVPTSLKRMISGTGILTCFPSTTPLGLALGID